MAEHLEEIPAIAQFISAVLTLIVVVVLLSSSVVLLYDLYCDIIWEDDVGYHNRKGSSLYRKSQQKFIEDLLSGEIGYHPKKKNYYLRYRAELLKFEKDNHEQMASFLQRLYYSLGDDDVSKMRSDIMLVTISELEKQKKIKQEDIEKIVAFLPPDSKCQEMVSALLKISHMLLFPCFGCVQNDDD